MSNELEEMLKYVFDDTDVRVMAVDEDGMREITKPKAKPEKIYQDIWELRDKETGLTKVKGDMIQDPDGKTWEILSAILPKDKLSTAGGSIFCGDVDAFEQEFKIGIFNLEWKFIKTEVTYT